MGETLTHKLIRSHLADGAMNPGDEIALGMDQALLQDATGTLAWLEFEQMGQDAVAIRQATQYVDHNILQTGYENADDHRFLRSVCERYGAIFSGPGNGISHWAHMERFDIPGETKRSMWAQWLMPFPGPEKIAPYRSHTLRKKRWSSAFSYPVWRMLWSTYCVACRIATAPCPICSNSSHASVPVASWRSAWSIPSAISSPGFIAPSAR